MESTSSSRPPSRPPSSDPDTARDTKPIRPLGKVASRVFVTVALIAAFALSVVAFRLMNRMASDPNVQERYEAIERMRIEGRSGVTDEALNADSTDSVVVPDSAES